MTTALRPSNTSISMFGLAAAAALSLALGCSDDGPTGTDSGTDDTGASSNGTDSDSSTGAEDPDTGDDTGEDAGEDTDTSTETDGETETGEDTETTGPEPTCEAEEPLGDWLFMLDGGDFPNDVPEDVDESCTVLDGAANQLALDCPFGAFTLSVNLSPSPVFPDPGASAQVRIHHEPGWLDWPDLWIDVEVDGGDHYAFQSSSVLLPTSGQYMVPWEPSLSSAECGPFILEGLGGPDSCGEQLGKELEFLVDGEEIVAWHGTYEAATVDGLAFEVWVNAAREYLQPPQFCDVSPTWYSLVTWREQG